MYAESYTRYPATTAYRYDLNQSGGASIPDLGTHRIDLARLRPILTANLQRHRPLRRRRHHPSVHRNAKSYQSAPLAFSSTLAKDAVPAAYAQAQWPQAWWEDYQPGS